MNKFINQIDEQEARTENFMKARKSTASKSVDFFYKVGALRGRDAVSPFVEAFTENRDYATRILLWARDIRQGAGERQIFRNVLLYLDKAGEHNLLRRILIKVPELGRWDDLLLNFSPDIEKFAFGIIESGLRNNNALCAKWMPRKGRKAIHLRNFLNMSPKKYRKTLVNLTKVVEQQMCAKDWDNIDFNHVPSLAASRYRNAFNRHTEKYREYVNALMSDDPEVKKTVKVNAGAVYPYDVIKQLMRKFFGYRYEYYDMSSQEVQHTIAQWDALPNYMNDKNILPVVDVSGSMNSPVGDRKGNLRAIDVAVSLGLYCADKNTGAFKDTFLTFSNESELVTLKGNILEKMAQMSRSNWGMSTNLHAAFENILRVAKDADAPQEDMPEMVLVLSDMQFNYCVNFDDSAMQMIARKYADAGYKMPKIVFWNLKSYDNVPVRYTDNDVALVSGFSPSIMKAILAADLNDFTPESIMFRTIMDERYYC